MPTNLEEASDDTKQVQVVDRKQYEIFDPFLKVILQLLEALIFLLLEVVRRIYTTLRGSTRYNYAVGRTEDEKWFTFQM